MTKQFFQPVKFLGVAIILGATLLGMPSCKKEEVKKIPPLEVKVIEAQQLDLPIFQEYVGQVHGASDVEIKARIDGWVQEMPFKEGSFIKKGDLLYKIDAPELKNAVDQAEGDLVAADAEVKRTQQQLNRIEPLVKKNAMAQQDLDNAQAEYDAAVAYKQVAQSALKNAKIDLSYARINSPINGIVSISNVSIGDFVSRSTKSLATVSQIGSVKVRFKISETDYIRFKKSELEGKKLSNEVSITLADGSLYPEKGKIAIADSQVDPETGSITMEAIFPNKKGLLRSGLYVKVNVLAEVKEQAIIIPQKAVSQMQSMYRVFVVDSASTLQVKMLEMGDKVGDAWVVKSGLQSGEGVALVGSIVLAPNSKVIPVATSWEPVIKKK